MNQADDRNIFRERSSAILQNAAEIRWDIAIIGAGPAGSVAASLLAARGRRVLLIEKSAWPREKVCGGCLNAAAVQALSSAGLASSFHLGQPITRATWRVGRQSREIPAPGGVAILRSDLDSALVTSAIERGCVFLSDTAAHLLPAESGDNHRLIQVKTAGVIRNVRAKVVLACDGISGTSVEAESWATWRIERNAWMGVSVTCDSFHSNWSLGTIYMNVGNGGYVGAVCLPGGRVHLAAALDPIRCRRAGGPAPLVEKILRSCGQSDISNLRTLRFRGTGEMMRRREYLGGHRVLAVGDACGYVEPFTGEGMAWAIRSAIAAADLLPAVDHWPDDLPARWADIHRSLVRQKQRWCKALRPLVHYPTLAMLGINTARFVPAIGNFLSKRICESDYSAPAPLQGAFG
jgi:flavin-dependent dehydrogenase